MIRRPEAPADGQNCEPKGFDDFDLRLGDIMRGERATLGKSLLDVQRELKIKAAYIAAIENTDPTAFETPGFIAGYVRSYVRFLGLDPEWAYRTFCDEGQFETTHGMSALASGTKAVSKKAPVGGDPFSDPNASFVPKGAAPWSGIQPGALGSVAVMIGLIGLIGYGGWSVLQEVQKVRFAPVDQTPGVVAELDPLEPGPKTAALDESVAGAPGPGPEAFDRLYRPQALDVPVLVARDAPIATLDPASFGTLTQPQGAAGDAVAKAPPGAPDAPAAGSIDEAVAAAMSAADGLDGTQLSADGPAEPGEAVQVVAEAAPEVRLFAVRPAWVRVRAADGTVILEKILDSGEEFLLPGTEDPPTLRSGNAGSVYFAVGGETYGPAGVGPSIVSDVELSAEALTDSFRLADLDSDADLAEYVAVAEVDPAE